MANGYDLPVRCPECHARMSDGYVLAREGVFFYRHQPSAELFGPPEALPGTSALMRLDGWTWEEMTVKSGVGMHVFWPRSRSVSRFRASLSKEKPEERRKKSEERIQVLRDSLDRARAYRKSRQANPKAQPTDLRWESIKNL